MLVKIGDCFVDPEEIVGIAPGTLPPYDEQNPLIWIRLRGNTGSLQAHTTMDEAEAALIDAGVIENPYPEETFETPALSDEERIELESLDAQGYEYLARDVDGKLYAYKCEPGREDGYYFSPGCQQPEPVAGDFLCVDADEAWSISFLLGE